MSDDTNINAYTTESPARSYSPGSWTREFYARQRCVRDPEVGLRQGQGKVEPELRARLVEEGKRLKDRIAVLEIELDDVEGSLQREGQRLPNVSHPQVRTLHVWPLTSW